MKKTVFSLTAIILLSIGSMSAQSFKTNQGKLNKEREAKREMRASKVLERKLAYFKENLMLDKKESEAFEKAYRDYMQKRQALKKQYREEVIAKVAKGKANDLPEKERQAIIQTKLKIDKDRYELNRNFTLRLTKILPSTKVIRYFKLNKQFDKKMLLRLKKRKQASNRRRMEVKRKGRKLPMPNN